jgi:hypothetical protein
MQIYRVWQSILMVACMGLIAGPVFGLSVLVAPGASSSTNIAPRLIGLGHTVYEIDPSTWDALFDYSAYDVVAFQFLSGNPADISHLVNAVDAGDIGVVFFRAAGAQATATALGLISSAFLDYQFAHPLSIVDNSHPITQFFQITTYELGYGNMTHVIDPGVNTTILANGVDGAALVVHNTRSVVATPYYGAYWEDDIETEAGLAITDNCLMWAAGEPIPVQQMTWGTVKSLYAD